MDIPIFGDDKINYDHIILIDKPWALYLELIILGIEFKF